MRNGVFKDIVQHLNYSGAYHFAWLVPLLLLFYFHMPKFRKLHMIHLLKFQQRLCLGCKHILNYGNIVKNRINISVRISQEINYQNAKTRSCS